ncbi:hypothetical protein HRbin36_02232 [bacterium HR36]|nr:hypothetical protein HRbin36_02232 [bacterium HR36]
MPIYNRARIAACVSAVIPNDLKRRPGFATIRAAFANQIDIAEIAGAVFAAFAKCQDRTARRGQQCGDTESMVPLTTADPNSVLHQLGLP